MNLPKPERSLIFAAQEYRARLQRLQSAMQRQEVDALLLTTPADVFYTTGFLTRFWESPARPWFVIVPGAGEITAVIPEIGAHLMRQTWVQDIRTWDAPDPRDDGVSLMMDALADCVPRTGSIGLPMGLETHLRMALSDYESLKQRLAPRCFVDATQIVQRTREIKSDAEIEKIKTICEVTARAFERVPEIVAKTPRLDAVFRGFQSALLNEGADWVSYTAGAAAQGGYGDVISPATAQELEAGDVLMLDTGAVKDGYFADFNRNFTIGPTTQATENTQNALHMAVETALETLRPGMRASDAHKLMADAIKRQGCVPCSGRFGHGLGVTLTEWPSFTAKDTTELRAGMVLTLEPSAEVASGGALVHEENIVLRADGCELLSPRAPHTLPVIRLP